MVLQNSDFSARSASPGKCHVTVFDERKMTEGFYPPVNSHRHKGL